MRIACACCIALLGCGGRGFRHVASEAAPAPAATVTVEGVYYWTDTVKVAAGSVVAWINHDAVDHTVSFEGKNGRLSGKLKARGAYAVRFDAPGVYRYYCDPHPSMRAVVIVH